MKPLAVAFLLLTALAANAEDMRAHLRQTQTFVQQARYREALERMIWFHENALQQDPSIYAERHTVALDNWARLAGLYPPAQQALLAIRNRLESRLLERGGSRLLFHDLLAINRALGEPEHTLGTFRTLHRDHPRAALQYWPLARNTVLEQGDPQLAGEYITDVMAEFEIAKKSYLRRMKGTSSDAEILRPRQQAFVAEARQLAEVAAVTRDTDTAIRIQQATLDLIDDPMLRDTLTNGLPKIPSPLPPAEDPLLPDD